MRDGERPGHLRRDALAHPGHRQQDLVGAFGEDDRGAGVAGGDGGGVLAGWAGAGAVAAAVPGAAAGRGGRGAAAAGAAAAGAAAPVRIDSTTLSTSSRVIRPPPPVPTIWAADSSCSRRSRRTAGVIRASGSAPAAGAGCGGRRWRAGGGRGHLAGSALVASGGSCRGRGCSAASGRSARLSLRSSAASAGRLAVGGSAAAGASLVAGGASERCPGPVAFVGGLDDRDLGVVGDGRAFLGQDLAQHPLERRRDLGVDLVRDDLDQRLVLGDVVARLLEPLPDRPLGDALAELGHRHLGHVRSSSEVRAGMMARGVRTP